MAAARSQLDEICELSGENETGGILIGKYSEDRSTAIVSLVTSPPSDSSSGHTWFVRGYVGLRELLGRVWRGRERRYYVGEWHYHPATLVEPSRDDIIQMIAIAKSVQYHCREPILLLLGRPDSLRGLGRPLRAFVSFTDDSNMELFSRNGGSKG